MKFRFLTAACGLAMAMLSGAANAAGELNVYNWGDYTNMDMIKKFEQAYDIKVTITDFDSNDTALAKVRAGGHGFDVAIPTSNFLSIWIKEGLLLVNAMHITASVFINDDESGLHQDYDKWLEKLAPHEPVSGYRHNDTGEDNADAHMKRQVMGREVVVAVTNGQLDFGTWEQIFYGEFDGRRRKRVLIKIIGE